MELKILVLIKQILDPAGVVVRRDKERIFVNQESYIIAPVGKNCLEAALSLKDSNPQATVTAMGLGPPRVEDALREAMAMGADAAYLLLDKQFEPLDLAGTAQVLAAAAGKIKPDLIIAGRESGSDAAGQIGPRLAEMLDIAQITDVLQLAAAQGVVRAVRRWGGSYATVETSLPALVTLAPGMNQPRYPHGARIMQAYEEWEVIIWDAAELGLEREMPQPLTEFRGQSFAEPRMIGERLRGDPRQMAKTLSHEIRARSMQEEGTAYGG